MLLLDAAGIANLVKESGITVVYETGQDFVCMCPFHSNRNTPSMTVSREHGAYNCFNPSCSAKGDFVSLIANTRGIDKAKAYRIVEGAELSLDDVVKRLEFDIAKTDEIEPFDQKIIDSCKVRLWSESGGPGLDYLKGRGFTEETLRYFDIGYSARQSSVTVPVHSYMGIPMGFIGRSIHEKRFLNSSGLQGRETLFNVHRAKRHGSTLIIVEASFDAMKIHQAGYPNVAALFKGTVTEQQQAIISRSFDEVVIFVDNDDPADYPMLNQPPGQALAKKLYNQLKKNVSVYKVPFNRYSGFKDATDMTDEQITYALAGSELMGLDMDI